MPSVKPKTLGKVYKHCRVSAPKNSVKFLKFTECKRKNTRQSFYTLPSVSSKTLGKVSKVCRVSGRKHSAKFVNFAECHGHYTRQSFDTLPSATPKTLGKQASNGQILWSLCRVSIGIHSAKPKCSAKKVPRMTENGLFAECFALTLGNSSLCRVLHSAKRP